MENMRPGIDPLVRASASFIIKAIATCYLWPLLSRLKHQRRKRAWAGQEGTVANFLATLEYVREKREEPCAAPRNSGDFYSSSTSSF